MLYKKNSDSSLSLDLFKNPTSEYRGTPFWAWNSDLNKEELCRQIDIFKSMGFGGAHLHVRTGLENKYLSNDFMQLVKSVTDKAKKESMLSWLYDEDRWPSGAAGGIVTENHAFRQRCITFSPDYDATVTRHYNNSGEKEDKDIIYLTSYDIVLDKNGYLISYKQINKNDKAQGKKWHLFNYIQTSDSWFNDNTYIDTLNPDAVKEFVNVTHKKYKEYIGEEFDKTVPAIFTDEPQVYRKQQLRNSFDCDRDISMPWTDRFPEVYKEKYNADIFDYLPEIIWQLPKDKQSPHRYYYHDLIGELFADSFSGIIGDWCDKNNIAFTGHMMEEPTLESQTHSMGDAMRSYQYFSIPGIDMLCNWSEFTTAKQCQSAVHQYNKEGMLSELYGVTSWDCDFRTYKYGGDWQAALGVTVRVPHLSWYAMQGEAKRDYPASISYQSPWAEKYHVVEDHFSRLNTALTRGKPVVKVAVIHPVESYWLYYGPNDKTELYRKTLEENFASVTKYLLEGSIDFDFICESLFPKQTEKGGNPLKVGCMTYDAVVVPGCVTLRKTTIDRLNDFRNDGGKLIFMGSAPEYCDAVKSEEGFNLWNKSVKIDFNRGALLSELEDYRTVTIRYDNGKLTDNYIYQLREDNDCSWLFICHNREPENKDRIDYDNLFVTIKGEYKAEIYDTLNGTICEIDTSYINGNTLIKKILYAYDSVLLKLIPGKKEIIIPNTADHFDNESFVSCDSYELTEDNVLLLDMAEWAVDDGEFNSREEILRLDNKAREATGLKIRGGQVVQPYAVKSTEINHTVTLKFSIESEINYKGAYLALEDPDKAEISFNGNKISNEVTGNFVDIKIFKIALPEIKAGINTLSVKLPLGERTNTEWMYILGKFGVKVLGNKGIVTSLPEKMYFGDLVNQGLPFYGGNIIYNFKAIAENNKIDIMASFYRGAALSVYVDGEEKGDIIYPPYKLSIDNLSNGLHNVSIKFYIHRYNQFGPVHLSDEHRKWHGPDAWRSNEAEWSYDYVLRRTGLLSAPLVK